MGSQFGVLLRQLRERAALTQEELAASARLSPRSVSDLERGISLTPRPETVRRLAVALGLGEQARVDFQAAAASRQPLADENVPAASTDPGLAAVRALPRDVAGFTGRVAELRQLTGLVTDAAGEGVVGICAIGGLAGIGKTSLAVHAAHVLAGRFPDGQLFVPLHAHTPGRRPVEPEDALAGLLRVAGYAGRIPGDLDGRAACWRAFAAGKRVLLVVDDAGGHEQVGPLLPGAAGSLVLVTSRRRLAGLADAVVISLDTMPAGDAARLLTVTSARAALAADDPGVGQVIRLCGYLPLAIALAGSQLRHHPAWSVPVLAGLLAGARGRLGLLAAENLSVASAFDLSYRDLTRAQRRLFRALGLYPGGDFDGYAAAALAGSGLAAADRALAVLYDQHLITEHVPGRYRMHDLLRAHAQALAASGDPAAADQAITRLLDYYLHVAQTAGCHWPTGLSAEYRFAPGRAPAEQPPLATQQQASAWMTDEHANLLAAAGAAAGSAKPSYAVAIAAAVHGYLRFEGPLDHIRPVARLHEEILASARAGGDRGTLAFAYLQLAGAQETAGQHEPAMAAAAEAAALFRQLGDLAGHADALSLLAQVCRLTSAFAAADGYLGRVLELRRAAGDRRWEARALLDLGGIKGVTGDYRAAESLFEQSLAMFRETGIRREEAFALEALGQTWLTTGRYPEARAALEQAREIHREVGVRIHPAIVLVHLASYHRVTGDLPAAAASIEQAFHEFGDIGEFGWLAYLRNELGLVQQLTGDYDAAAASHRAALRQICDLGDRHRQAETLNNLGELSRRTDDAVQAATHHAEALALALAIGCPLEEARALEGLGRSDLHAGRVRRAVARLTQAQAIYQRLGAARVKEASAALHGIETAGRAGPADEDGPAARLLTGEGQAQAGVG